MLVFTGVVALHEENHGVSGFIDINYPFALVFLFGLPLLVFWAWRSLDNLTRRRRRLALGGRLFLYLFIILALSDLRWQASTHRTAAVWLIDVSQSVGQTGLNQFLEMHRAGQEEESFDDERVVFFSDRFVLVSPYDLESRVDEIIGQLDRSRTDFAGALRFAQAVLPPGTIKTVIAITDGRSSTDWSGEGRALKEGGISLFTIPIDPPDKPEVLVRELKAPQRVREGEPFIVETEISSRVGGDAEIKIYRNGALAGRRKANLKRGKNRFSFSQSVSETRLSEFTVEVVSGADSFTDNNRLSTLVHSSGNPRVLLVSDKPHLSRFLALALKQEGILLEARPPTGMPSSLAGFQNFDLVIADNVSATELSPSQLNLLSVYVRDFGGGFLMLGGDQAFGLGGYYRTVVENLLPVRCDFEKEREDPSLGLVLIIDKSGSMSGQKLEMAKEASKSAVELLTERDFAGVLVFDGQAFWAAELQPVVDKYGLIELISTVRSGGGTSMAPAMELALSQLSLTPAKLKHVILLTDGHSQPGPFYELTLQMVSEGFTVSTVALGQSADQNLLEQISQWGNGRFYFTEDAVSIPRIFAKETMTAAKSAIKEIPFLPQTAKPAPFLAGIDFTRAPFLYGYVTTRVKPTADVWLLTERSEPLLATWRYGLGQTGAFTSDARNRWAVEWLRWDGFGVFWSQLCRYLMRSASLEPVQTVIKDIPGGVILSVDMVDESGRLQTGMRGEVFIMKPGGERIRGRLNSTLPGQMEIEIRTEEEGIYHLDLVLTDETGEISHRQYLTTSVGYPNEYRLEPADRFRLASVAEESGGKMDPVWSDFFSGRKVEGIREIALWPWFLGITLIIFLFDVAARRWPGDY